MLHKILAYIQWRAGVCWCPGRLLDCMPLTEF